MLVAGPATAQNREVLGEYRIGLVGRGLGEPYYQAVHAGARAAARDLAEEYSIDIELLLRTPVETSAQAQLEEVSRLFVEDADGLAVSPVDGALLRPLLDTLRGQGVEVALFEGGIEDFQPLAFYPAYEERAGRLAALAVAAELPRGGRVAILAPQEADANMLARLEGVRAVLGYRRIYGLVKSEPDYASALAAMNQALEDDGEDLIAAWIFLADWPLRGPPALPWEPGRGICTAIGASPTALKHLEEGHINALVVHPYYEWGYRSIEALVERLHEAPVPDAQGENTPPPPNTGGPRVIDWTNRAEYEDAWRVWMR